MTRLLYFLKIYLRNLIRPGSFARVNIIGLSIGLTVSLMILIFIRYETTFDRFNPIAHQIYRIVVKNIQDGSVSYSTPLPLSDVLRNDYPQIDKVIGIMPTWDALKVKTERFTDVKGAVVEKDFFALFHFPLIEGDTAHLFHNPDEAVVTTDLAYKLYGSVDPVGKTFEFQDQVFTITGVIRPMPSNSIFHFDFLLSDGYRYRAFPDLSERWYHFGLYAFVTFKGDRIPEGFVQNLTQIEKKYYPEFMKNRNTYLIVPFAGSHLNSDIRNDLTPSVSPVYLWLLGIIALGILAIACLNFINIAIANSGKKSRETGIKKVQGATPSLVILDIFSGITLLVVISLLISLIAVHLLFPYFNMLVEKSIVISYRDSVLWAGLAAFGLLTILGAGLYPAILFARATPDKVIAHRREAVQNKLTFQKSFVVLEFSIAITLLICLVFIFRQIRFMQNHDTGFDKTNLVTIPVDQLGKDSEERLHKSELFARELENNHARYGYSKSSITEFVPGFGFRNLFKIYTNEGKYAENGLELLSCDVDKNFLNVFGLKMLQGRFFADSMSTDRDALIINETAYRMLGWKSIADKSVSLFSRDNHKQVIGVISDINVTSLQHPILPMIYQFGAHHNYPGYLTLRLSQSNHRTSIAFLRNLWKSDFPEIPFEWESVSEKFNSAYGEEKKLSQVVAAFSLLAMLLSLLGIWSLSALECEHRTKEIGIRRVNGGGIGVILMMLNRNFIKWVVVAFLLACPAALLILQKWLQHFTYRTHLAGWIFCLAGVTAVLVAFITLSWQSWKAASRNPVDALRYE